MLAIGSVNHDSLATEKVQMRVLFDMMKEVEDPRGGDALAAFLLTNPRPHWRTEAALRLAEVGDLRAVPHLAWRLAQDPLKLYNTIDDEELRRDDNERVQSARMLADLAILHPEAKDDIRTKARRRGAGVGQEPPAAARQRAALSRCRRLAEGATGHASLGRSGRLAPEARREGCFSANWATAQSSLRLSRVGQGTAGASWKSS